MENKTISPNDLVLLAHHARVMYVAHEVSVEALMSPDRPLLAWQLGRFPPDPSGDAPIDIEAGSRTYRFSARETLTAIQNAGHEDMRNDMVATGIILGTLRLGDAVKRGGYHDYSEPLLEFLRHYRNACAHGGRWKITVDKKHGWRKAQHRDLEITPELDGEVAVLGTVDREAHLHLLEDVAAYFQTFALRSALKEVHARYAGRSPQTVREQLDAALVARGFDLVDDDAVESFSKIISAGLLVAPKVLPEKHVPIDDLGSRFPRQGLVRVSDSAD